MRWSDVIYLVPEVDGENSVADPVVTDGEPREVYANRRSIRQSEFYQAAMTDLRPEIMFEIRSAEYQGEPKVRYEGRDYSIIRTYDKGETMELICAGLVGATYAGAS